MRLVRDWEKPSYDQPTEAEAFLSALAAAARPAIDARHIAIVTSHPDDETLGCGAQLARLRGASIVCVTDGAPRNPSAAGDHGFSDTAAYGRARQRELRTAVAAAGVSEDALIELMIPDQAAAFGLPALARRLARLFVDRGIRIAVTHSYEGGHPDHDAAAFAVHAAGRLLARRAHALAIVEMPFYRLGPAGPLRQCFAPDGEVEGIKISLRREEQLLKARMAAAYVTQRAVLSQFSLEAESFRVAPRYDFTRLPNEERLLYEQQPWGMTGLRWRGLVDHALRALGLRPV